MGGSAQQSRSTDAASMPRSARVVAAGSPHHITQRGNNPQDVFLADEDRLCGMDQREPGDPLTNETGSRPAGISGLAAAVFTRLSKLPASENLGQILREGVAGEHLVAAGSAGGADQFRHLVLNKAN